MWVISKLEISYRGTDETALDKQSDHHPEMQRVLANTWQSRQVTPPARDVRATELTQF